ncbi:MAG: hypothetical protein NZ901_02810 [Geminocystis sp.]|nr:hypothetical protein [Geminocystis sp.]HIK36977.1 hypothetical protein [Geminocystis sp. M7585_C2015_104]MCS7147102.1 hypothetical protein [Geminocystis sp.]MCX8079149.1 hypothetical protein [Geminocystis sp.]MDW8116738.1 hypothetical protein [Geminocystis sp.]
MTCIVQKADFLNNQRQTTISQFDYRYCGIKRAPDSKTVGRGRGKQTTSWLVTNQSPLTGDYTAAKKETKREKR